MTELLQKAFNEASNLPDAEQDLLASWILDELGDSDRRWNELFERSRTKLRQMAAEAKEDYRQGRTDLIETIHLLRSPNNAQRLLDAVGRALKSEGQPMSADELRRMTNLKD